MGRRERLHGVDARGEPVRLHPLRWRGPVMTAIGVAMILAPLAVLWVSPVLDESVELFYWFAIPSPERVDYIWPAAMVVVLVPVAVLVGTILLRRGRPFEDEVARRLGRGVCPRCSYRIDNLPADADGCTPCPECGAAWRLEESHAQAPRREEED